jgi:hypothetical protein
VRVARSRNLTDGITHTLRTVRPRTPGPSPTHPLSAALGSALSLKCGRGGLLRPAPLRGAFCRYDLLGAASMEPLTGGVRIWAHLGGPGVPPPQARCYACQCFKADSRQEDAPTAFLAAMSVAIQVVRFLAAI